MLAVKMGPIVSVGEVNEFVWVLSGAVRNGGSYVHDDGSSHNS